MTSLSAIHLPLHPPASEIQNAIFYQKPLASRILKLIKIFLLLTILLLMVGTQHLLGQRSVSYTDLVNQADRPNLYTSQIILPSADSDENLILNSFRIDYDLLTFRRIGRDLVPPVESAEYYAAARMDLEIYRGSIEQRGAGFEPVVRRSWSDTAWTDTFEQTRSRFDHLEGWISTRLQPGEYSMFLEFNRGTTQRQMRSRERTFTVPDFDQFEKGQVVLLKESRMENGIWMARMLNYGEQALYGQDYEVLVLLPSDPEIDRWHLDAVRLAAGSERAAGEEPLFSHTIHREDLITTSGFKTAEDAGHPELLFQTADEGYSVALVAISASAFPNVRYRLSVRADEKDDPLAVKVIQSRWIDMPVSLLNLDVAIDMLRFIVDDRTLRDMRRGTREEQERKFREFWNQRDPTPDSEFNELMAEYYSRIDYAWQNFTTPVRPGYESDQGRTYILYGQPVRKERTFPAGGPTREIWYYRDRTLVFEATTGFGDFRLVEER